MQPHLLQQSQTIDASFHADVADHDLHWPIGQRVQGRFAALHEAGNKALTREHFAKQLASHWIVVNNH